MKAKAKVNLFLHINGLDSNSYHLLESMAVFATDIYDSLEIRNHHEDEIRLLSKLASGREFEGGSEHRTAMYSNVHEDSSTESTAKLPAEVELRKESIEIEGEFAHLLPNNSDNLLHKLIRLLDKYSDNKKLHINLAKNIPISAGLGGGSADVAILLAKLIEMWQINLSDQEIKEICMKLGSDIYCCYFSKSLYFSGTGEIIEKIDHFPEIYAVLVNPLISVNTKEIFSLYRKNSSGYRDKLINRPVKFDSTNELVSYISNQYNDLEPVASAILPEINIMREALLSQDQCLMARMSGSGASYFGLYPNMALAQKAAQAIKNKYPHWWCKSTILS